ncbi:hypothetical protein [Maricaulis sp. CAU 1757]
MSFNRVRYLSELNCVEAVIDGYEDWQSAMQVVEEMIELAEDRDWVRFLIDFRLVDMRVSVSEAPDIATFFDNLMDQKGEFALLLPVEARGEATVRSFGGKMVALGHSVVYLKTVHERDLWLRDDTRHAAAG